MEASYDICVAKGKKGGYIYIYIFRKDILDTDF